MKVCAVVVFYNPESETYKNILSYLNDVDKVFVIDNSDGDNSGKLSVAVPIEKIEYVPFYENKGLAYALNFGCRKAIYDGFDYCLTMDQDSVFEKDAVRKLKDFMFQTVPEYAAVCPNIRAMVVENGKSKESFLRQNESENQLCNWTMTSGTLMSLNAYEKIGGFDEKLFIGHIDVLFGYNLKQINAKMIIIGNAVLQQHFGHAKQRKLFGQKINPYFGSPVRVYYTWRNEIYLRKKYGKKYKKNAGVKLWKSFVKILIYEDEKVAKFKMMLRGIFDARTGKMNKFQN